MELRLILKMCANHAIVVVLLVAFQIMKLPANHAKQITLFKFQRTNAFLLARMIMLLIMKKRNVIHVIAPVKSVGNIMMMINAFLVLEILF